MELKVEFLGTTTVKPSSPTPPHLNTFQLSIFDQLSPSLYVPLLLYYSDDQIGKRQLHHFEKSQKLKCSLSQILTHFYPLAGRIKDNFSIECTDEGVKFIETKVDCTLSDILKLPDTVLFKKLLPGDNSSAEARSNCLLVVQVNFFNEGGLVIGVCISHKIVDGSTLGSFVNAWSGLAVGTREIEFPIFGASAMFRPEEYLATVPALEVPRSNCVTRRYLLNAAKIAALKSLCATESVSNPTSVEAVSALIWKCATKASRKHHSLAKLKPSALAQAVNLRKRLDPPLPDSYVGNLVGFFTARIKEDELEIGLQTLVTRLREGKDGIPHYVEQVTGEHGSMKICQSTTDYGGMMMSDSIDFYGFTSWCRFPFYEADFGWGKPRWVSLASDDYKNFVKLIDAPAADGIEAWVSFGEEEMAIFERDEELLEFAVLNPSIPEVA